MGAKIKILHLEDLATDAELIERAITKSEILFDKIVVDNREDYKKALSDFAPDIIISDHSLPSFNSMEALEILKASGKNIPFILVTATISEEFAVTIMKLGAWDYILKDRLQRLPSAITNALEKDKLEKEKQRYIDELIANGDLMKKAEQLARLGSWESDMPDGISKWSDEAYRLLGYEPGQITSSFDSFINCVHPEDAPYVEELFRSAIENKETARFTYRIIYPNGTLRYLRTEIFIDGSRPGGFHLYGFNQDITETRIAEESLKQSEANLTTIFNHTNVAYVLLDNNLFIQSFNQSAKDGFIRELGFTLAIGKDFREYLLGDKNKREIFYMRALEGEPVNYEASFPTNDGDIHWFNVRLFPVMDQTNGVIGIILAIIDITKEKKARDEREKLISDITQRNKDLEQFAYIVSHNLRAPTANIMGIADVFKHSVLSEGDKMELMAGLSTSVKKLDNIIIDLNNILKVKKEINESREFMRFSQLLQDITLSIDKLIQNEKVVIKSDFSEINEIISLKSYMHSIFYNLITNSIKYKRPGIAPVIEIKSYRKGDKTSLVFKDNGMGIDLKTHNDKIFGLYKRFHFNIEGKGMGLFMTKTQVETLGGKIFVKSKVNEGTEFKIQF